MPFGLSGMRRWATGQVCRDLDLGLEWQGHVTAVRGLFWDLGVVLLIRNHRKLVGDALVEAQSNRPLCEFLNLIIAVKPAKNQVVLNTVKTGLLQNQWRRRNRRAR